jgi:trans-aconitate methyltransferase
MNMDVSATNPFGIEGYSASTYGDSFADVYDEWYADLDDADFVTGIVAVLPSTPVQILELGVGTGRLIEQLVAQRSPISDSIIGVDSSVSMLDVAATRTFTPNVTLQQCDFSTSLPDGRFDLIFVGYNTLFNLPDERAMLACFRLVASRLAPHGIFAIDVVSPLADQPGDHVAVRTMATSEVVLAISSHDIASQRITGQFVQFTDGGTARLRPWSVRYFTPTQLDALAAEAGLVLVTRHEDGIGTAYTADSFRHVSRYSRAV